MTKSTGAGYKDFMELSDATLVNLYRIDPANVPITKIGRCLGLLSEEDGEALMRSLTRRRPRNDIEREILLHFALTKGIGGLLFVNALGGFRDLPRC